MSKKLVRLASMAFALLLSSSLLAACTTAAPSSPAATSNSVAVPSYDTITLTWYPNESANGYQPVRDEIGKLIAQATGKKVTQMMTTDYTIAVSSLANGTAQIGCAMGVYGYLLAQQQNPAVKPLFVNSGASGTLDDAVYYSWLCVNEADAKNYQGSDGKYSIANIAGKRISFVSTSSTSGFLFPASSIVALFGKQSQWKNIVIADIQTGGSGKLFSDVLFGQTHQGSAVNLLSGKADVAAFCDTELANYAELVSGTASTPGAVYKIKDGAQAPFDTLVGKTFTIIQSMPVLNGPFAYNSAKLNADDVKKIQDLFTSDTVTSDALIFKPTDSKDFALYTQSGKAKLLTFDDKWYDPIRAMIH